MTRPLPLALAALLAAALAPTAGAAPAQDAELVDLRRLTVPLGEHALVALPASLRFVYGHVTPVAIAPADADLGDRVAADNLGLLSVRLVPSLVLTGNAWPVFQAYQVGLEVDARYYLFEEPPPAALAHDPERLNRRDWVGPRLIQAWGLAAGRHAALKLGLLRSHWGLGLLANQGDEPSPSVAASPFGHSRFADRVARVQLAVFPLAQARYGQDRFRPLTVALAADAVVDDANASWQDGDRAYHGILAVMGRYRALSAGLYAVYRNQEHAEGGQTEVAIVDVQARVDLAGGGVRTWLEGELAALAGTTDYSRSVMHQGRFDMLAVGGVVRFGLSSGRLEAVLEAGLASGDDNPFDARLNTFTFNREHRVGLLMFREGLKDVTATQATNIADPDYRGRPPRGYDRLPNGGAVQGAQYINPRVAVTAADGLTVLAGLLYGVSATDYTDPFWSGLAGGTPTGPNGAVGEDQLGVEVDLGVHYRVGGVGALQLSFMLEGAWWSPGAVFDSPDGVAASDVFGLWLHTEAAF
jgi:hypothetical protein